MLVVDTITDRRVVQGRQGIDEAGGQTAQTAVAERHVGLLFTQIGQFQTEFTQRLFANFV